MMNASSISGLNVVAGKYRSKNNTFCKKIKQYDELPCLDYWNSLQKVLIKFNQGCCQFKNSSQTCYSGESHPMAAGKFLNLV